MKVRKHTLITCYSELRDFALDHVGETFTIEVVKPEYVSIVHETEQSEAEMHMDVLNTFINDEHYIHILTEEEKTAMEFSIDCIKTLKDMGVIK